MRHLFGALGLAAAIAVLATTVHAAAQPPRYRYGETWWEEYESDKDTRLLLHFGAPSPTAHRVLSSSIKKTQADEKSLTDALDEPSSGKRSAGGAELPGEALSLKTLPPMDESSAPAGVALDYSDARRPVKLGAGMKLAASGRFGSALSCDGSGGVSCRTGPVSSIEGWFRVESLPAKEACLFSVAGDESRLLLRPDGKLELRLKKPHGVPSEKQLTPEAIQLLMDQKVEIVAPEPIRAGEWFHVVVYAKSHPMPGGGEPWDARLKLNGSDVAWHLSERFNTYSFLGNGETAITIGDAAAGGEGFVGLIDEIRVSSTERGYYERPASPWGRLSSLPPSSLDRPLHAPQFNRPFFRNDSTVLHASLDSGVKLDIGAGQIDVGTSGNTVGAPPAPSPLTPLPRGGEGNRSAGETPAVQALCVDGIRGKAWVMDPETGFARVPIAGLRTSEGALEFWLRPCNWDDMTGYWHHTPPLQRELTVARLCGKDKRDGTIKPFLSVLLPRAYNLEQRRVPVDPGHWLHLVAVWDASQARLYVDGHPGGNLWRAKAADLQNFEPAYVEFGVSEKVLGARNQPPRIEIDEIVGYNKSLAADEVEQARRRWMGKLEPIKLYDESFSFKWSLQKLEFALTPLLPEGQSAASCSVKLCDAAGANVFGPTECRVVPASAPTRTASDPPAGRDAGPTFRALLSEGKTLPYGKYQFRFEAKDAAGQNVITGTRDWNYEEEPWRQCRAGILDKVPPPWTPMKYQNGTLETRTTKYVLGPDGLPKEIFADGVNILAAPMQILEDGKPLQGTMSDPGSNRSASVPPASPSPLTPLPRGGEGDRSSGQEARTTNDLAGTEAGTTMSWSGNFTGQNCDIAMRCTAEYDGMIRYELSLKPKGKLAKLSCVIPIQAQHATRCLYYPVGARGVSTGEIGTKDGAVITSRADPAAYKIWQEYQQELKKSPKLSWEEFWQPRREKTEAYGFYTHVDINDCNRGLWWFCDNAAGWAQSKTIGAVEVVRAKDVVSLVLNLVAEAVDYTPGKPIVFAILPHPARPMPEKYRLFNRVPPEQDGKACDIYDAFFPWPQNPKAGEMCIFPAADPLKSDAGPSWSYAESCVPMMKASKPKGYRTMYLSKAWLSCRAGAYDNWEWRSGDTSTCSLTPSFVNYLCWEMNEWIKRDIFDAIYLDECYEHPTRNVEAGQAVLLPDGTVQPGVTNFQFRELMKRWRGIFHANGKEPLLISHLTYSFQYPGVVFCDSYLDGENRPIVSVRSPDWIDSTSKTQYEVLQNGRLWGVSSFYMPFVSEGGFEDKSRSQFPRWQWRMARQAQSQFAHYETATVYEGQGAQVYKGFWKDALTWGVGRVALPAGTEAGTTFHPYWDNAAFVECEGNGGDALVSFYKQPGKVLLIASNRGKVDKTLKIKLNLKALGLRAQPAAKSLDSTFEPPAGADFLPGEFSKKERDKLLAQSGQKTNETIAGEKQHDALEELNKGDVSLEDPSAAKTRQAGEMAPKLDGDVLSVPVRGRDYRVITLE
ncbi:MAG TPA: LamG-like jellyroll fold domain-containing protein [Planctomycetota bacterium]|jgi:hypothetical protein